MWTKQTQLPAFYLCHFTETHDSIKGSKPDTRYSRVCLPIEQISFDRLISWQ